MTIYSGFSHWKWWFSIVMLVYQRVTTHSFRSVWFQIGRPTFFFPQDLKRISYQDHLAAPSRLALCLGKIAKIWDPWDLTWDSRGSNPCVGFKFFTFQHNKPLNPKTLNPKLTPKSWNLKVKIAAYSQCFHSSSGDTYIILFGCVVWVWANPWFGGNM